jgi:phytanoyl-CoA hydroxylase
MQPAVAKQIKSAAQHVKDHGYTVIKNFISKRQCQAAINEIDNLIENFQPTTENTTVFDAVSGSSKHRLSKYFLDSSDKVSFFFEPKALVDGKIVVPKLQSINKIGHSLHEHNKIFEDITYAPGVW